jgi:3,4-dihydroxy-2-butanone 4-phosphate synthase
MSSRKLHGVISRNQQRSVVRQFPPAEGEDKRRLRGPRELISRRIPRFACTGCCGRGLPKHVWEEELLHAGDGERIALAVAELRAGRAVYLYDDSTPMGHYLCSAAETSSPKLLRWLRDSSGGLLCYVSQQSKITEIRFPSRLENHLLLGAALQSADGGEARRQDEERMPVIPLKAHSIGVCGRSACSEALVDLAQMAGLERTGFLCAVSSQTGSLQSGRVQVAIAEVAREKRNWCMRLSGAQAACMGHTDDKCIRLNLEPALPGILPWGRGMSGQLRLWRSARASRVDVQVGMG